MIVTVTNASASPDIPSREDSAKPSAPRDQPISMENVSVMMECLSTKENAEFPRSALSTVTGINLLNAVSVTLDTESSTENALATNTVESMDIFNTDNATARKDTSGSSMPAEPAVSTKPSTESPVNATSDTVEMPTVSASRPTSSPSAMKTKDMMPS